MATRTRELDKIDRKILRILQAEDVRIEMGRSLSRKEREYVRLQLELGPSVREIVRALQV